MNFHGNPLPRPLEGIRIVECGVWHAGPGGCAILADLGAEVIKIESLRGDPERALTAARGGRLGAVNLGKSDQPDWSVLFEISNRNKKGICVDLATQEGREILAKLVQSADVFMTNYRRSTVDSLHVDYEAMRGVNPKIIHVTVSGYGPEGELADTGAFDPMGQAISGMVFITGSNEPIVLQLIVLDQLTAIAASHAMLTALVARDRQGHGQAVHVSLYGSAIWLMYANILATSVLQTQLAVGWNRAAAPPMRNCYKCADGKWLMGTNHPEHKYWPVFFEVIGLSHLEADPRFATPEARLGNLETLIALIDEAILARPRDEWLALLRGSGLQYVPVQQIGDVLLDPQARANGYIVDVDHPVMGLVSLPGYPAQFGANGTRIEPAPGLGQHTTEVLAGVGFSAERINALRAAGIVK